jgi:glycerophosphoryl diester phosphodiesterase
MWHELRNSWAGLLRGIIAHKRHIVVTHAIYSGLGIIVLFPLVGLIGRLLLGLSGQSALVDQDILYFALTPVGATSGVLVAALFVFIIAFESASMMAIGVMSQLGKSISVQSVFRYSLTKAPEIFGFAVRLVCRLLLLTLPFLLAAVAIAYWLLTEYDINFYLSNRPPAFWSALFLIGADLLIMLVIVTRKLLDWSVSLSLVLFADVPAAHSFERSTALTRNKQSHLLLTLIIWTAVPIVLSTVVFGVLHLLGSLLVPLVIHSLQWLVLVLGSLFASWLLANLLLAGLSSSIFAFVIIDFYEKVRPETDAIVAPDDYGHRIPAVLERRNFTPGRLVFLLILTIGIASAMGLWLLDGIQANDSAIVIAHRGASGRAPENTLLAIQLAVDDGADWVEIDVQETADGEVIVYHDRDFMKLAGVNLSVANSTLDQVNEIDIGSWFNSEFAAARAPTLAETLRTLKGKSRVIIELKYYGHSVQLEQRVVDIVEQADMADDVMIMSLSLQGIQKIQALRPNWTAGLLAAQSAGNIAQLDVDFLAVSSRITTSQLIRRAGAAGKPVYVWTVNDAIGMSRMLSLGVDGIITDEPALARQVLAGRSELNSVERLLIHSAALMGQQLPSRVYRDDSP